ncbi:MAG: lipopolysaccharide biosynthesis protein [Rikenellaceae bacterium]|nr:lipopolysaccharide biosynthesis protein [Rikenellaceae bacterium]
MLEKLAKQTAVYGISTIVVRFLSYLLTPFYTRVFGPETYGIVTDVYALIPFALVLLSMGMESSYFRFAAKAEADGERVGKAKDSPEVKAQKRRLFASCWGMSFYAAILFALLVIGGRSTVAGWMGESYVAHPEYIVWVALIILFDVWGMMPFSRLREQGRPGMFVLLKALNVSTNVALAFLFGFLGLYDSTFGVGWVFVANLAASLLTWLVLLTTVDRTLPKVDWALMSVVLVYSLPLLVSGIAGTAGEFLDRQMIKYLVPEGAMAQLGIYGAITKIAVVMMLFTQMYRLAAEPFFLANYRKSDFVQMNAAAMKYFLMASMLIFLVIALFKEFFALIVGRSFREGIFILPVVLGANVLSGVWLNLSFWYKREERTGLAIRITGAGVLAALVANWLLVPRWGYYGAAWGRFLSEVVMVGVSYALMRRYYPIPYDLKRMGEFVGVALALFLLGEWAAERIAQPVLHYGLNVLLLAGYAAYLVWREKIDVKAMAKAVLKRG